MLPFNHVVFSWLNQVTSKILREFLEIYNLGNWKVGSVDMKFISALVKEVLNIHFYKNIGS